MRGLISLSLLTIPLLAYAADAPPATRKAAEIPWGQRAASNLQARLSINNTPSKGGAIEATVELRNTGDTRVPAKDIHVWFVVAQGKEKAYFTEAQAGSDTKALAGGEVLSMALDPAAQKAFAYDPALQLKEGVPTAAEGEEAPKSVGTLSQVLPTGRVRAKAFVVYTSTLNNKAFTDVVPTNSFDVSVSDGDFARLDETARKSLVADTLALFRGDAVAGKAGHDKCLKIGAPVVEPLIAAIGDAQLSEAGRMWLVATLVDLGDKRAVPALIKEVENGGGAASVIAYHGPRLKSADLNAAIAKTAASSKDLKFAAWAARGLGKAGKRLDPALLEAMVKQSDPAGRGEAVDILLEQSDASAVGLLAKLIGDADQSVRLHAIQRVSAAGRREKPLLLALAGDLDSTDEKTRPAAQDALKALTGKDFAAEKAKWENYIGTLKN